MCPATVTAVVVLAQVENHSHSFGLRHHQMYLHIPVVCAVSRVQWAKLGVKVGFAGKQITQKVDGHKGGERAKVSD